MASEVPTFMVQVALALASTFGANYGGQPEKVGEIYLLSDDLYAIQSTAKVFEVQDVGIFGGRILTVDANTPHVIAAINMDVSMKMTVGGEKTAWGGFLQSTGQFHVILESLTDVEWWKAISGVVDVFEEPQVQNVRRDGNVMAMDIPVSILLAGS